MGWGPRLLLRRRGPTRASAGAVDRRCAWGSDRRGRRGPRAFPLRRFVSAGRSA